MNAGLRPVFLALLGLVASSAGVAGGAAVEVDFDVPPEYAARQEAVGVLLIPKAINDRTPCVYGISPPRGSKGSLETDAVAALTELVVPGWQPTPSNRASAMRGTAAAGWPYFWYRAEFQNGSLGNQAYVSAMAMVFPAGPGRVNVVFGMGGLTTCFLNDASFAQLFHSLRPRGWSSDGGNALARDLVGTWTSMTRVGMSQHVFGANGRYARGSGTHVLENLVLSDSRGRYDLRGSELTIGSDGRRYRVSIYDEWNQGPNQAQWKRSMALLAVSDPSPDVVRYSREP